MKYNFRETECLENCSHPVIRVCYKNRKEEITKRKCMTRVHVQTLEWVSKSEVSTKSKRTLVEEVGDFCLVLIPHSDLSFIGQECFLLRVVHQRVEKCVLQPKHNKSESETQAQTKNASCTDRGTCGVCAFGLSEWSLQSPHY